MKEMMVQISSCIEGDKIPAIAKIIAIADVFDAINSNRLYKKKKSLEALLKDESLKGKT